MQLGKPWCSTCCVHFNAFEEHREHSKSEEHVFKIQIRYIKESWNEPSDERPGDESELYQVEAPEFLEELCLFCRHRSSTFDENIAHMKTCHSSTIPTLKSHGIEPITVARYLHRIIFGCYECISRGKQRRMLEGIQHHMVSKNHCRYQMTCEITRICKNEESYNAQESRQSQETRLIRSTYASHNDRTIIQRPTLPTPAEVLCCESTGDNHHMYKEKQQECCIFGNSQVAVTEMKTPEMGGDHTEATQQPHRAFHEAV
ncbi:related to TRI15-putative transcription factor [Fusarium oxysporum]|uniref:Related to TRI15-putative transcription factor n=1 Tax=Fusarium oxysporum TaxID=5507 RepID=A0A2H3SLF2_FUSOX|nr:related to TRI15-putative transcription factor [Fusarium oxysporum]